MYLIKAELGRRLPEARRALADCQQMHKFITGLFGTDRQSSQILYRTNLIHDKLHIYMYAQNPAKNDLQYNIQQLDITPWLNNMAVGQTWNFDLIASPSKKIAVEGQKNSQRRLLRHPSERRAWLERKAEQFGFEILYIEEQEHVQTSGKHSDDNGGVMYHDAYHYQGTLRITDAGAFRKALQAGIGPGKAYGFGMLCLVS